MNTNDEAARTGPPRTKLTFGWKAALAVAATTAPLTLLLRWATADLTTATLALTLAAAGAVLGPLLDALGKTGGRHADATLCAGAAAMLTHAAWMSVTQEGWGPAGTAAALFSQPSVFVPLLLAAAAAAAFKAAVLIGRARGRRS